MGAGRAPLLLAVALVATAAAGPATADRDPWPRGVPSPAFKASVRPPAPPREIAPARPAPRILPVRKVSPVGPAPRRSVSVRPPAAPRKVSKDGSVPGVSVWRSPVPGVSIAGRPWKQRPIPRVTGPGMTIFPGAVCQDRVQVGPCPRGKPRPTPRPASHPASRPASLRPTAAHPPSPTPEATPPVYADRGALPLRRKTPLATVLVMVVLVTTIASTTAIAFGRRR